MELNRFLVQAKIRGYASEGEGGERTLAEDSKELTIEENKSRALTAKWENEIAAFANRNAFDVRFYSWVNSL